MSSIPKKSGPFDVKTVESLVALMTQNDLNEIYLRDGSQHLRLRRGGATAAVNVPATLPVVPTPPLANSQAAAPSPEAKSMAAPAARANLL